MNKLLALVIRLLGKRKPCIKHKLVGYYTLSGACLVYKECSVCGENDIDTIMEGK